MLKIVAWAFLFASVLAKGRANVNLGVRDMHCNDLCSDVDTYMPSITGKWPTCERGCRFFNLIFLTDGHNVSETKEACHLSCKDAYGLGESKECMAGCDATLEHLLLNLNEGAIIMADVEILESEIFVDSQIPRHNIKHKIPESKFGKMPIDTFLGEAFLQGEGDSDTHFGWMNCISKQAKVIKLIAFHVFLLLVIVGFIWYINVLNTPVLNDDTKPIYDQDKEYYDSDLDPNTEKSLEKEEVKVMIFPPNELSDDSKNPKV